MFLSRGREYPAVEPGTAIFIGLLLNIEVAGSLTKLQHVIGFLAVFIVVHGISCVELSPQLLQCRPAQSLSLGKKCPVGRVLALMTFQDDGTANIVIIKRRPHRLCGAGRRRDGDQQCNADPCRWQAGSSGSITGTSRATSEKDESQTAHGGTRDGEPPNPLYCAAVERPFRSLDKGRHGCGSRLWQLWWVRRWRLRRRRRKRSGKVTSAVLWDSRSKRRATSKPKREATTPLSRKARRDHLPLGR